MKEKILSVGTKLEAANEKQKTALRRNDFPLVILCVFSLISFPCQLVQSQQKLIHRVIGSVGLSILYQHSTFLLDIMSHVFFLDVSSWLCQSFLFIWCHETQRLGKIQSLVHARPNITFLFTAEQHILSLQKAVHQELIHRQALLKKNPARHERCSRDQEKDVGQRKVNE